jgi:hypothetical protein
VVAFITTVLLLLVFLLLLLLLLLLVGETMLQCVGGNFARGQGTRQDWGRSEEGGGGGRTEGGGEAGRTPLTI